MKLHTVYFLAVYAFNAWIMLRLGIRDAVTYMVTITH
jgi:hypothetical protein